MAAPRDDAGRNRILAGLTDAQRSAVTHVDGPLLIIAGPGSGKTRVVTHRIAYLLSEGVAGRQILALTFTNKAADEMRQRLGQLVGSNDVWTGTYHRFCARLLRHYAPRVGLQENYSICDPDDAFVLLSEAATEVGLELGRPELRRVAAAIGRVKNEVVAPEDYQPPPMSPVGSLVDQLYGPYQRRMRTANAADFDDLLLLVAQLLRQNQDVRAALDERFRYILVDEYQDTNLAQYLIVRALSNDYPNLAVTGDPDQSIYGWRGANIRNIMEFERDFPKVRVVRLEQNYRSTKRILRVADALIEHNAFRKEKSLYTDNSDGAPVRLTGYGAGHDEAAAIAARIANEVAGGRRRPRDFAVFYRMNALSRGLERALRACGIPYQIVRGLEFYQRAEIKDVLAYLHLLNNPANDAALLRIINRPTRGIGKKTIERVTTHARRHDLTLLAAARESGLIAELGKGAAVKVAKFVALYDELRTKITQPVATIIDAVYRTTRYRDALVDSMTEQDAQRLANLNELLTDAQEFDEEHEEDGGLEAFLEQTALVADVDGWEMETDRVTLMTLHAAKGLEFPVVFVVALEDGVLPHSRSKDSDSGIEEERRLLFVGMTRAEQELHLSYTMQRSSFGKTSVCAPSRFLVELPREEMEFAGPAPKAAGVDFDMDLEWDLGDDIPDELTKPIRSRRGPPPQLTSRERPAKLQTAAEMLASNASDDRPAPGLFQEGMEVVHPDYGRGCIIHLDGSGRKRKATVQFASRPLSKTFTLAHSPLRLAMDDQ